jgi:tetratricopeptide (TPR) repeat protein
MKKTALLLSAIVLFITGAFANKEDLKKGWDAFNANKRTEAIELFKKSAADADTKADANLSLSMVYWSMDKNDDAFRAFQDFYDASENPYPYLYALWSSPSVFNDYGRKEPEELKFLAKILADPKANGTIKSMAHSMLGKHYESFGDFKKMREEFEQIGSIDNWAILGTFDNTSASGFNKDFGALTKPQDGAVFKNKLEADISWYQPPASRADKWFDFDYYLVIGNSIMYAQTFVNSDADRDVYLRSGNSGSLKIWVNDKLVTNVQEERNCDLDVYINNIKLKKGYNRILVQIGESETDNANFMIRLTDKDGNPVSGLTSTGSYQAYTKSAEYTVNTIPFFAEEFFENKVKTDSANILNHIMLAETYMRNDKVYEARKALKKARKMATESTFMGGLMIEAYARDKNVTDLTKENEAIKSKDPESIHALKEFVSEAGEREDYDDKEKHLKKIKELYGESMYTDFVELELAANRNKDEEVLKMSKELYEKYPESYDLMRINYQIASANSKDLNASNNMLKAYLKNVYSDRVMTQMANNYFKLGKRKDGIEIYNKRIENYPYVIGYYDDMTDLYYNQQNYEEALAWAEKTKAFAPYIGAYWKRIADIYDAMGKPDDAKENYKKALYYNPNNYEARKKIREIEGKKPLFENFAKIDAYEIYKNSPKAADFPEDNSIILINDKQLVVYPEGATEEKAEVLIKVFNQTGIDTWKEYSIGYNSYRQNLIVDKAEVLKPDGSKVQAERSGDYVVFTNLEAGNAIHLSYRLENYNTGKLAQHFWEQFNFNFDYPSQLSRYSIIIPAGKKFEYQVLHSDMKPTIKDLDDNNKMYTWELKDQPSIKPEVYMPGLVDVGIVLDISTLPDWQYVSNWYSDLSSTLAKSDFEIKETVAELFKDKKNLSEIQKAKAIYEFIEENVSYSNVPFMHGPIIPQKASRTLNTKLGDCKDVSTLFVAMCKEVGLKANLILVDTRDNGEKHLNLPSIDFNHCIAQLQTGGKTYYIELTDQKLPFAALPLQDIDANALFIPRDNDTAATRLIKLNGKTRVPNTIFRETNIKVENNDLTFTRTNVKTGMFASQMRNEYGDLGKEKQEKDITQAIASDFTNPAKLLKLEFKNLDGKGDTVVYDYSFNVKNELTEVVGIKIMRLPWSEAIRTLDFLSLETRKYPFLNWAFTASENTKEVINLEVPKGKILAETPKNVSISCPAAEYTLTYSVPATGKLKAVREFKYKNGIVNPDEYAQFREFFNKVAEADAKQIGFKNAQ